MRSLFCEFPHTGFPNKHKIEEFCAPAKICPSCLHLWTILSSSMDKQGDISMRVTNSYLPITLDCEGARVYRAPKKHKCKLTSTSLRGRTSLAKKFTRDAHRLDPWSRVDYNFSFVSKSFVMKLSSDTYSHVIHDSSKTDRWRP